MKKCDKHHGDIEYDEKIYLECPMCKVKADLLDINYIFTSTEIIEEVVDEIAWSL